jgi:hypothetical protein
MVHSSLIDLYPHTEILVMPCTSLHLVFLDDCFASAIGDLIALQK